MPVAALAFDSMHNFAPSCAHEWVLYATALLFRSFSRSYDGLAMMLRNTFYQVAKTNLDFEKWRMSGYSIWCISCHVALFAPSTLHPSLHPSPWNPAACYRFGGTLLHEFIARAEGLLRLRSLRPKGLVSKFHSRTGLCEAATLPQSVDLVGSWLT